MKSLPHEGALFTSAELAEVIGADLETIKNWVRRGIISRARIGGRQMPNRLFSEDEVYKIAVTYELVKLGLAPSAAAAAANTVWEQRDGADFFGEKQICAILFPTDHKWTAVLCWQLEEGGPLYRLTRSSARHQEKIQVPDRSFAVIPITVTLARVTEKLGNICEGIKQS
jgi:hypothetical protein